MDKNRKMITILIGISGSGKSTLSEKKMLHNANLVRVNRDSLRTSLFMMDSLYYSRPDFRGCEKLVSEISEQLIYDSLHKGKDIIIDNTNLQKKYIDDIIRKFNHLSAIELVFVDVELGEARNRVNKRENFTTPEQAEYISRQHNDYQKLKKQMHGLPLFYPQINAEISFNKGLPPAYIFDIDGNLALKGDRDIFDDSKLHLDTQIKAVAEVARALHRDDYRIIYLSGRQDSTYLTTKKWLEDNGLWFAKSEMFMRKAKDQRCDSIVKEELIIEHILPKYNVIGVFDDRERVCRAWYKLGVFCFNTNQNLIKF